jgi:hypothetical protein
MCVGDYQRKLRRVRASCYCRFNKDEYQMCSVASDRITSMSCPLDYSALQLPAQLASVNEPPPPRNVTQGEFAIHPFCMRQVFM